MIGIRNNSLTTKSAELWVNELRLVGFESRGGSAARANMSMKLSDIGNVDFAGQMSTAGYGALEQGISQRSMEDFYKYSMTTSFDIGRFLPEQAKVSLPIYYSYTKENVSPYYSPYDTDLILDDVIDSYSDRRSQDSIRSITQDVTVQKNFSISNARIDISGEKPMPYDPANFSASFSSSVQENSASTIVYENDKSLVHQIPI